MNKVSKIEIEEVLVSEFNYTKSELDCELFSDTIAVVNNNLSKERIHVPYLPDNPIEFLKGRNTSLYKEIKELKKKYLGNLKSFIDLRGEQLKYFYYHKGMGCNEEEALRISKISKKESEIILEELIGAYSTQLSVDIRRVESIIKYNNKFIDKLNDKNVIFISTKSHR